MKKIFAKFALIVLSITIAGMLGNSLAYAKTDGPPPLTQLEESATSTKKSNDKQNDPAAASEYTPQNNDTLKNTKFSVTKVLSLDNEDQKNSLFESDNPPIIALILRVIEFATRVIGSISIIVLIIGGFMFMFSQGNEQNLSNAKDVIKYAAIGLIVTFMSFIIVLAVQSLFFGAGV